MAGEDPDYLSWLRGRHCAARGLGDSCEGEVVAHHDRHGVGLARRAHDHRALPLCVRHHHAWHHVLPPFRLMTRGERQGWAERGIELHRALYRVPPPPWA